MSHRNNPAPAHPPRHVPADGHVTVYVDGRPVQALPGQSLAAVLHQAGRRGWRRNPVNGEPRGPYCGMGACFECEAEVDGIAGVRTCLVQAVDGLAVTTDPRPVAAAGPR